VMEIAGRMLGSCKRERTCRLAVCSTRALPVGRLWIDCRSRADWVESGDASSRTRRSL